MPIKSRLEKLSKTVQSLPAQPEQPKIDRVIVHADDGCFEYATDAAALAAHPWLSDPAACLTVVVTETAETGRKRQ